MPRSSSNLYTFYCLLKFETYKDLKLNITVYAEEKEQALKNVENFLKKKYKPDDIDIKEEK